MREAPAYSAAGRDAFAPFPDARFVRDWESKVRPFSSPSFPSRVIAVFRALSSQWSSPAFNISLPRYDAAWSSSWDCLLLNSASFSRWAARSAIGFLARGIRDSFSTLDAKNKEHPWSCSGLQYAPFKLFWVGRGFTHETSVSQAMQNRTRRRVRVDRVTLCRITHDALPAESRKSTSNQVVKTKAKLSPFLCRMDTGCVFLTCFLSLIGIHHGDSSRRICNKWPNRRIATETAGFVFDGRTCA